MRGVDFETATRGSGTSGVPGPGWWGLYGPRVLVSLVVVTVLAGGDRKNGPASSRLERADYTVQKVFADHRHDRHRRHFVLVDSRGQLRMRITLEDRGSPTLTLVGIPAERPEPRLRKTLEGS